MSRTHSRSARSRRKSRSTKRQPRRVALLSGLLGVMVACGVATATPGQAQAPSPKDGNQPVLLSADSVTFDEQQGLVTARGNVELSQSLRTVRADTITYNRTTKVVTATGNIRIVEPSGDILFADYAELTDDMRDAFVENLRVLMTDNSRMAGNEAERRGERILRVNRGVYSPCELCKEDPTRPPLWQVRAVRVVHDKEEHEIRYKDAVLEMFGVPVAYTPYLSQPDATVDRKSGFLTPLLGSSSDLGLFIRPRYYIDMGPDQDATVEVGGFSKQGLLLGGEYRKRFERGRLTLNGSVTQGELPNGLADKNAPKENKLRGHFFARGLFEIDEVWRAGFDVKRASDETYLRKYFDNRGDDFLTSRAFVEGFRGRNYAAVSAYSWQDLRYGNTVEEPIVGPLAVYSAMGEPGSLFGGRWSLDSGILSLYRRQGASTRRFHVEPGWRRDITSSLGFVTTFEGRVLAVGHNSSHYDRPETTAVERGSASRFLLFPQGQVTVRYPFARYGESSQQLIEPLVAVTTAPRAPNDPDVPNEDSQDVEFDQANLFMFNRFPGIDRLEGGTRITYGLRTAIYGYRQGSASLFVGQSYRFNQENAYPAASGLRDRRSDYVGRLDLSPASWLDANYSFRIDPDTLRFRRHSLSGMVGVPEFTLSTAYSYLDNTPTSTATRTDLEQITIGVSSQFAPRWSVGASHVQSLRPAPGPRAAGAVLTYQDECFTFQTIARRDYTNTVGDVKDGNTLYFRLVFKNLGEFRTPGLGGLF
ncbi:organic solvent tolerance protein [Azospirillum sp. TSO22-1]|nr:organic solvent tolerance protein [Azospirillum sp. TSO22-1]